MRGIQVEPSDRQAIVHALRAGRPNVETAEDFGVSLGTVKRIRREIGLVNLGRDGQKRTGESKASRAATYAKLAGRLAEIDALDSFAERRGAQLRLAEELRREA